MTTSIAKYLVHSLQKVQGTVMKWTVITDKMLGFLIYFVGIVLNVSHFITILGRFHVYCSQSRGEDHAIWKQVVKPKSVGFD